MHDRVDIIWLSVTDDLTRGRQEEVSSDSLCDVVEIDLDEIVAIRPLVFVPETQGVSDFVDSHAHLFATK